MTHHALSHPRVGTVRRRHRRSTGLLVRFVLDRFLLLPLGAAIAIVWANTASESYFRFAHALAVPVNEIGMALFLGLIAQETFEAIMPGGALHTWRRWGLPVVAAAGGFAGAAVVYLGYVHLRHEQVLGQAWPIACAIDVAAGYYLLKLIYPRSPALPFLLVLALATNAAGLAVLAGRAPFTEGQFQGVALFIAALPPCCGVRTYGRSGRMQWSPGLSHGSVYTSRDCIRPWRSSRSCRFCRTSGGGSTCLPILRMTTRSTT